MESRRSLHPPVSQVLVPLVFFAVLYSGCASPGAGDGPDFSHDTAWPPAWAVHPPQSDAYIYAVGWSGRTYRPSKAREQALQRAVAILAAQARIYVKNQMVMWQDKDRVIASDSLTESRIQGKVEGFTIVAERRGVGKDVPESDRGSVYILIRIPKKDLLRGYRK